MASRRDLYQSYQFMMQRLVSGIVLRETDPPQSPLRRMGGAAFASVMIAILSLAAAGVIGVIKPGGNTTWKDANKVIVEEETGTRYVYIPNDQGVKELHPVPNLASAALLVSTKDVISVSQNSLAGTPRAARIGIANAPDSLPAAESMLTGPWTLCSLPAATTSGEEVPNTALVVGREKSTGVPIQSDAVLVRDTETNTLHLVVDGHQYPIKQEDAVLEGLGLRNAPQVRVGTAWLSALPAGKDLEPYPVANRGAPSTALAGAKIGEVRVVDTGSSKQYYVVLADKIRQLTAAEAQITLADPTLSQSVYAGGPAVALALSAADANSAPRQKPPANDPADPPATAPTMANVSSERSTMCASFKSQKGVPEVAVQATVEGAELAPATPRRTQDGAVLADRVLVNGGSAAIVESMLSPTANTGPKFLVTDEGKKYALKDTAAVQALGYGDVKPVQMPASLVARIPSGPSLDSDAARQPL
ncbi:type VII secretion protein EccB [Antricoccus suffuscus]|uniref:Type VII secretion protein EccB n=1 Tax=Antricoccus suffuscus TaxID=1629062 RepID=A0A2T0ZZI2_9ACTN|nr:type VII secretion protein EccB [Antricoccus suffuscus]PRZ41766.1 type VII secretion protein EccB [Antricoccus suffuscus]